MSSKVSFEDELFTFIPFLKLPARQRAGVLALSRSVALYGQGHYLAWTFEELRGCAGLGAKEFKALVVWIDRLCLGELHAPEDTPEAAVGIRLTGLLQATIVSEEAPLAGTSVSTVQQLVADVVLAAIPSIIRQHEAERRRRSRSGSADEPEMSGTTAANVPDISPEKEVVVPDSAPPPHGGAHETYERNERSNKSYSSNESLRSYDVPDPEATVPPEICERDVVQRLVERSFNRQRQNNIVEPRARKLVQDFGVERCLQALLMLGNQDLDRPGGFLNDVITKPEKYTIPAETVAEAKRLLSPSKPKQRPRAAPTDAPKRAPSEEDRVQVKIWAFQETMTEEDRLRIDQETVSRMTEPSRSNYRTAMADKLDPPILARAEFNAVRLVVLREWALRESGGSNPSQGG
jgi:hypothetical protein